MSIKAMEEFKGPLDPEDKYQALAILDGGLMRGALEEWREDMLSYAIELVSGRETP